MSKDAEIPVFHSIDLKMKQDFLRSEGVKRVTVYGGSKSAFDSAFLCASAGKQVDWVIRPSGQSVACMFAGKSFGGKTTAKLGPTRLIGIFSPCIYNYTTWHSRFLHGTVFGKLLVQLYWGLLTRITHKKHRLHSTENGRKLIPKLGWMGSFWAGSTPPGISSEPKFWDVLHDSGLVTIHRAEITSINKDRVSLSTGTVLSASSAVIMCTGWIRNSTPFISSLQPNLGVPMPITSIPPDIQKKWDTLDSTAEETILEKFPLLANPPPVNKLPRALSQYRLYRLIAPPELAAVGDNSVAFVGTLHTAATGMLSEIQALWAIAYLEGKLKLPAQDEMEKEVAEVNAWMHRRYLNLGEKCHNLTFEYLAYMDTLLQDLGIESQRKKGLYQRILGEHTAADYKDVVEKWVRRECSKETSSPS